MANVAAAQYLRMSTEHQQYSLVNQAAAIQQYAEAHGFSVAQTYSDGARTGLVLKHRSGLRQLLHDVSGSPAFKAILVYDVSRWGRFQDSDEAAHYEFLCKSAGVPVHYCAETFANDGTLTSLIMKALKRTMAGEYSRELGVKVLEGQKRLARLGFKQGASQVTDCGGCLYLLIGRQNSNSPAENARALQRIESFWFPAHYRNFSACATSTECWSRKDAQCTPLLAN